MSTDVSTRSIAEMRIDALSRIAEACVVYDLPAPMHVFAYHFGMSGLELRMDDDQADQVDAWAEFLSLPDTEDIVYEPPGESPWIGHRAQATDHRGGSLWLGFQSVQVWTAVKDKDQVTRLTAPAAPGGA